MTYEMWRKSGLPDCQVIGTAGTLDSNRFRHAIARAADVQPRDVRAITMGSHEAEMVPVGSSATVKGRPLADVLAADAIAACVKDAMDGGAQVVGLHKTGSAFIASARATVELPDAMRGASAEPVSVSAMVRGEYVLEAVFLGTRARLSLEGVAEVIEDRLAAQKPAALVESEEAIRGRGDGE